MFPCGLTRREAIWQMGGAWLVQHAWGHYDFARTWSTLERAWPLLRGCAEFCLDWLVEGPDGYLDTCPSTSPENWFLVDGEPQALSWSVTMDVVLIRAVFERTLALEPRHFGAWAGLGQVLYRMEDRERALAALNRALAIHPYLAGTRELVTELTAALRRDV